jgi:hypothetical protein
MGISPRRHTEIGLVKHETLVSNFAFNFKLRTYAKAAADAIAAAIATAGFGV